MLQNFILVSTNSTEYAIHSRCNAALASDGTLLWSTRIGTEEVEGYQDMVRMPNGDYVLSGRLHQDTTNYPPIGSFVARLDANGQRLWSRNVEHPDVNTLWPVRF